MATVQTDFYNQNPLRSPLEYQALVDRNRLSDQAVQANALAFKDRERALQESTALRNALAMGVDPRTLDGQSKLMQVAPNAAGPVIKSLVDAAHVAGQTTREEATRKKTEVETQNLTWEQRWKQVNKAVTDIASLGSADEAREGINAQVRAGKLDMQKATALLQSLEQVPFGEWQRKTLLGVMDAKDQLAATKPQTITQDLGGSVGFFNVDPNTGKRTPMGETPKTQSPDSIARERQAEADRLQRENQPAKDTRPVVTEIVDPNDSTKLIKVDAVTNRKIGDAGKQPVVGVNLSQKDIQKREATYPKATASVKQFDTSADTFVKDLEMLRDHKGLDSITGIAAGRIPGITDNGRAAQALYDKVTAKGGFSELSDMRAASPTGGALGQVSNAEGQFLRAAFAEIDRKQEAKDVRAAIDRAIEKVKAARQNIHDAYDLTYEYRGEQPAKPTEKKPSVSNW